MEPPFLFVEKGLDPVIYYKQYHSKDRYRMKYTIEIKPQVIKDCKRLPKPSVKKIFMKIEDLSDKLKGNVKRLTNFTPEYRLRVGDYRILFEIENDTIVVYRVKHRKEAYK